MKYIRDLLFFFILFLLPISGCIQGQATVSLNHDGSGKVMIEAIIDPCIIGEYEGIWQAYRAYLGRIKETLLKSQGIAAWRQVEWKILPNGRYYFRGQAYFESINDFVIYAGRSKINLNAYYIRDANNSCLELRSVKPQSVQNMAENPNSAYRYNLFAKDVEKLLDSLRFDVIFVLPGKVQQINGFSSVDDNAIHCFIEGRRMNYLLDYINENGLYEFAERWKYSREDFLNNELLPMYFANIGGLKAGFADDNDLFDYDKEQSQARKDIISIIERIDAETAKAKINEKMGQTNQSAERRELKENDEKTINEQMKAALIHESRNEYAKALEIYSQIIASKDVPPRFLARANFRSGMCYFELGDDQKAIEYFEYVVASYPDERLPMMRSMKMINDIHSGLAVRKAEKIGQIPIVVESMPELYMQDVNSNAVDSITVSFSQPMDVENWFCSSFGNAKMPTITGLPYFDEEGRKWTLPVKLEPNEVYAIGFNCGKTAKDKTQLTAGFRNITGKKCKPFVLVFATMSEKNEPTDINIRLIDESESVNSQ